MKEQYPNQYNHLDSILITRITIPCNASFGRDLCCITKGSAQISTFLRWETYKLVVQFASNDQRLGLECALSMQSTFWVALNFVSQMMAIGTFYFQGTIGVLLFAAEFGHDDGFPLETRSTQTVHSTMVVLTLEVWLS